MKVLTKRVTIEDKDFVLVQSSDPKYKNFIENNNTFYGLIPYTEIDEQGKMKRALNGFEMGIADSVPKAIENVQDNMRILKWKEENPQYSEMELIEFIKEMWEEKQEKNGLK